MARIKATMAGKAVNDPQKKRTYVIDFDATIFDGPDPVPAISCSAGTISGAHLIRMPLENTLRLAFQFEAGGALLSELNAKLTNADGVALSEVWLSRWLAD